MPDKEIVKRGGAKRWRTIRTGNGKYLRIAIVPRKGKRGGHTVSGQPRKAHTKISTQK